MPAKKAAPAVAKPTYAVMVHESIKALGDRTGSSVQAISKQLRTQYRVEMINKHALIKAIKKGVESGDLVQIKASYKINKKAPTTVTKVKKPVETKKKAAPKKEVTKKTTTSSTKKAAAMKPKKSIAKKPTRKTSTTTTTKKSTTTTRKAAAKKTSASAKKRAKK